MRNRNTKEVAIVGLFEKMIRNSKAGRRLQPNGNRISKGTISNYEFSLKLLREFESTRHITLRLCVNPTSRELRRERLYWKRFYKDFTNFLYRDKGHFDNYVGQTIKNLRLLFNYLEKDLCILTGGVQRCFYVRKEEISILPLLPEELRFLIQNRPFESGLTPRLSEVKDFFVFGCTVALRFSDLVKLRISNLRIAEGATYLVVRAIKTGTETTIRLPGYALDIIARRMRYGRLLPQFNKSSLNKQIKKLLEKAGFTSPVQKIRTIRGVPEKAGSKSNFRSCDLATTHTMRRTAITTMLSLGVPEPLVRKISGHAPGSKEFYRYVSWAQSYQDRETERMFTELVQTRA